MNLRNLILSGFLVLTFAETSRAAIIVTNAYDFGAASKGTDSVGTANFTTTTGLGTASGDGPYTGSGDYATFTTASAASGANWSSTLTATTSWAIGLYVRSSTINPGTGIILGSGPLSTTTNSVQFLYGPSNGGVTSGGAFGTALTNQFWIGGYNANNEASSPGGSNAPTLISANTWTHLAVLRNDAAGTYAFYRDGTLIGTTTSAIDGVFGTAFIGGAVSGGTVSLDGLRIATWNPAGGDTATDALVAVTAVPEPSTILVGITLLAIAGGCKFRGRQTA